MSQRREPAKVGVPAYLAPSQPYSPCPPACCAVPLVCPPLGVRSRSLVIVASYTRWGGMLRTWSPCSGQRAVRSHQKLCVHMPLPMCVNVWPEHVHVFLCVSVCVRHTSPGVPFQLGCAGAPGPARTDVFSVCAAEGAAKAEGPGPGRCLTSHPACRCYPGPAASGPPTALCPEPLRLLPRQPHCCTGRGPGGMPR